LTSAGVASIITMMLDLISLEEVHKTMVENKRLNMGSIILKFGKIHIVTPAPITKRL